MYLIHDYAEINNLYEIKKLNNFIQNSYYPYYTKKQKEEFNEYAYICSDSE